MAGFTLIGRASAPVEEVWKLLFDPTRFPEWWVGVETVQTQGPDQYNPACDSHGAALPSEALDRKGDYMRARSSPRRARLPGRDRAGLQEHRDLGILRKRLADPLRDLGRLRHGLFLAFDVDAVVATGNRNVKRISDATEMLVAGAE